MIEDVKQAVSSCRVWEQVRQDAEDAAERYVSSVMVLPDEDEQKQVIKSQYIDLFMEEVRKII